MKTKTTIIMLSALLALFGHAQSTKDIYVESAMSTHDVNTGCLIFTDILLTSESVVETEVEICDFKNYHSTLFCARGSSAKDRAYLVSYDTANGWTFNYGATTVSSGVLAEPGRRYVVRATPDGLYVDGVRVLETTPASFSPPGKLALFANYTYAESTGKYTWSTGQRAQANFWWFKVYGPDGSGGLTLEHELLPCQCTNGIIGMYDEKTGVAWANTGSRPLGTSFTIPAPGGVGDVVALTNALARMNLARVSGFYSGAFECRLSPGIYDLSGIYMDADNHLYLKAANCKFYGMGQGPADTVLRGGGAAGGRRVLYIASYTDAGECTVSNLTVTGGYKSAGAIQRSGGGIYANNKNAVVDCIVSNNYGNGSNGGGGGGIFQARLVKNCLVADNTANWYYGGGVASCTWVEDCVIANNYVMQNGGGAGVFKGTVRRCLIAGNRAKFSGGGQLNGVAIDCAFIDNVARYGGNAASYGGGLYSAVATNCVFSGNSDNGLAYGSAASASTLVGCTVSNSVGRYSILDRCRLVRSHVADVGASTASGPFQVCGRDTGVVIYTNVNSIIENVTMSNDADRVAIASAFVNCTIRNAKGNATYGPLAESCVAVNTIISGCEPYDVTAATAPAMTNCLYRTASGEFAEGRLVDCIQANPKFKTGGDLPPLSIGCSSPAYNAGCEDGWILNLVGDTDFAGNPRRLFGRIDIGALECQSDKIPGLRLYMQ